MGKRYSVKKFDSDLIKKMDIMEVKKNGLKVVMDILAEIRKIRNEKELDINLQNSNPYRILINEKDGGLTAYYFSFPIYGEDKRIFKGMFVSTKKGYEYNGINVQVTVVNNQLKLIANDEYVVIDFNKNVFIEPTINGIAVTSRVRELKLIIEGKRQKAVKENERFFALMETQHIPYLLVNGIVGRKLNEVYPLRIKSRKMSDVKYELSVSCDYEVEEIFFEINMHLQKMIYDTTINSKYPDQNNVFGGVSFLGESNEFGKESLYTRFDVAQLLDLSFYIIEDAKLYMVKLNKGKKAELIANKLLKTWCTFGMTWNKKVGVGQLLKSVRNEMDYEIIDVKEVIYEMMRLRQPRSPGFEIRNDRRRSVSAVATGDSYYYPQILEIKLKK